MRVLVCGGRDYSDYDTVCSTLNRHAFDADVLIQGGASGADELAVDWAEHHQIRIENYPADWKKYGRSAGYIRNAQMLQEGKPDLVIAFPGGKGTAMMVKLAEKAKIKVIKIK